MTTYVKLDRESRQAIIEQLGGRRFQVMTGAEFRYDQDCVIVKLPRKAAKGIGSMRIMLAADDTYTMTFFAQRGSFAAGTFRIEQVSEFEGVYCDQLQTIFTDETGLYTSL